MKQIDSLWLWSSNYPGVVDKSEDLFDCDKAFQCLLRPSGSLLFCQLPDKRKNQKQSLTKKVPPSIFFKVSLKTNKCN